MTLKMASAQVVETSVANNSPSQDYNHPEDLFNQGLYSWVETIFLFVYSTYCKQYVLVTLEFEQAY